MKDKQIIDVTQCPYHKEDKICTYLPYKSKCDGDCNWTSYKEMEEQLKAKEQECETLASQLDFEVQKKECLEQECEELKIYIESNEQQVKEVETLVMDNDRLINELDQLKAELNRANCQIADDEILQCDMREAIEKLKAESDKLKKRVDELEECEDIFFQENQDFRKIYSCLQEIKEIAKHCIKQDICTTCDYSEKCHIEDEEIPTYDVCKLILQKISEVENE